MRVMSNGRIRRSQAEWHEVMKRFESAEMSAREFCESEGIHHSSFVRWERKLRTKASGRSFVPVVAPPAPEPRAMWTLEIKLPNGCQLRFEG